ncbi:MAG: hypothetical protein HIU90_12465 [Proteobacteria bacterium]|jgi:intracellular multiplication protein IcmT|nr:hypothetical protein [Pseudomonadota bacterium]
MWRDTMKPLRLFIIDAWALVPALIFLLYWSLTTLVIALVGIVFFGVIGWFGVNIVATMRILRRWLVGPLRPAVPRDRKRRFV